MSTVATRKKTLAASPKRAAILKSAIAEFVEHGFERTSVEQIAAAAGVALQTVYAHFGSKNGLVEAIERECLKRPADLGDFRYASTASLDEQLRSMASAVVRVYMSGPYVILMRIRMSLWIDAPDRSTFSLSEAKAQFNAPIVEWIAAAVRDGRLVCQDPHQAAAQFLDSADLRPMASARRGGPDVHPGARTTYPCVGRDVSAAL